MPKPLKRRVMTLAQLRKRTLKLIRATRKQLWRQGWEADGMTDTEFEEDILDQLEEDIKWDIEVEENAKRKETTDTWAS